jgi:hypothetical protein
VTKKFKPTLEVVLAIPMPAIPNLVGATNSGVFCLCVGKIWWLGTESNRLRQPFQGCALPMSYRATFRNPPWRGLRGVFTSRWLGTGLPVEGNYSIPEACRTKLIIATAANSLNVNAARSPFAGKENEVRKPADLASIRLSSVSTDRRPRRADPATTAVAVPAAPSDRHNC